MTDRGLRVLVVGGRRAIARAFCAQLNSCGMEVCVVGRDASAAVVAALAEQPDVCVVDARMGPGALETVSALATSASEVPVVLLGASPSDQDLLDAIAAGAAGYLTARMPRARLEPTLRDAANGRSAFPRRLDALLMAAVRRSIAVGEAAD